MLSRLLSEEAPFDPVVADMLLEDVGDLAVATEVDEQGLSRLPMELEVSATFIRDTVDYLLTGVENTTLEDVMQQVRHFPMPHLSCLSHREIYSFSLGPS